MHKGEKFLLHIFVLLCTVGLNIPLAADERAVASSRPLLLILNKSDNTMVAVDPATLKVVSRVATGNGPHEVAVSADGRLAYVANYGTGGQPGDTLSIVDLTSGKGKEVNVGLKRPHGIVEHGGKIYFTAEGSQTVARFDPASEKVDWSKQTGQQVTHMVVVTPDGKKAFTANIGSDSVTAVDIGKPDGVRQIAVGKGAEAIDLSPDGRELWVGNRGDGTLSIIDPKSDKVKETIKVGEVPIRLKFTPDGKRVLVSDAQSGELIVVEATSRKIVKRIPVGGTPVGLLITPDGKKAFVAATASNKVFEVNLDELAMGRTVEPGREPDGLAWVK
jgi:YVTN family beta-propeller protein